MVPLSDERGDSFIGMHIEILLHSDDSSKVDDGAPSERVKDGGWLTSWRTSC